MRDKIDTAGNWPQTQRLIKAREQIKKPGGWARGQYKIGEAMCIMGAAGLYDQAREVLPHTMYAHINKAIRRKFPFHYYFYKWFRSFGRTGMLPVWFNDFHATKEDIIKVLDTAIEISYKDECNQHQKGIPLKEVRDVDHYNF